MKPEIFFSRAGGTSDEFEVSVKVSDMQFAGTAEMYTNSKILGNMLEGLENFLSRARLYDFQLGKFGPEFSGGAVHFRFHKMQNRVHITIQIQSRHFDFSKYSVASEAKIFATVEIAKMDLFLTELRDFVDMKTNQAVLEINSAIG